ncbi:hypothetical protein TSMEX_003814 [Taenia solium]|eukprot:TsM_000023800 transcript=TsM_000023800 gene=TsM_000023800
MGPLLRWEGTFSHLVRTTLLAFKEDFCREFDLDLEPSRPLVEDRNNSRRNYEDEDDDTDDSSDSDESSESDESSDSESSDDEETEKSEKSFKRDRKCCLCCACCECFLCFRVPGRFICDKLYYKIQRKIDGCPNACPTLIPRSVEEEWRFKGHYGARFAICESCASAECVVGLKWLDTIFCPVCALWEIVKGIDFGYRRFRIQAYIHRHHEGVKGFKTIWV